MARVLQIFVAVHRGERRTSYAVTLAKSGVRDRAAEDAVASRLMVRALAEAAQVKGAADVGLGLAPGSEADGTEQLHVGVTFPVWPDAYSRALISAVGQFSCSDPTSHLRQLVRTRSIAMLSATPWHAIPGCLLRLVTLPCFSETPTARLHDEILAHNPPIPVYIASSCPDTASPSARTLTRTRSASGGRFGRRRPPRAAAGGQHPLG